MDVLEWCEAETHLLTLLYPTIDDFWCEFICDHLLFAPYGPSRPAAHWSNVGTKKWFT